MLDPNESIVTECLLWTVVLKGEIEKKNEKQTHSESSYCVLVQNLAYKGAVSPEHV